MRMARAVVFDVDDTLYLEREYVRSGFRAVARAVETTEMSATRIFEGLWAGFVAGDRGSSFDVLLRAEPMLARAWSVGSLVALYREHRPDISLLPGMAELLGELASAGTRMAVLTDGPASSQRAKIEALGIRGRSRIVVLTDELPGSRPKPAHDGYLAVARGLEARSEECVYVGDNPKKDFRGARELGWATVRLRIPGQLHEAREPELAADAPDAEVRSVRALAAHLLTGGSSGRRPS